MSMCPAGRRRCDGVMVDRVKWITIKGWLKGNLEMKHVQLLKWWTHFQKQRRVNYANFDLWFHQPAISLNVDNKRPL